MDFIQFVFSVTVHMCLVSAETITSGITSPW